MAIAGEMGDEGGAQTAGEHGVETAE